MTSAATPLGDTDEHSGPSAGDDLIRFDIVENAVASTTKKMTQMKISGIMVRAIQR